MRLAIVLLCFALAGCMTTDDSGNATDWSKPAAAPAQPAAADPPAPATRRPAQALRGTSPPPAPAPEPVSHPDQLLEIRQTCWAQGSKNRALTLEARADWVNKCIADKTKQMSQ